MEGQTSLLPVQARAPHPPTQSLREECSSWRRRCRGHTAPDREPRPERGPQPFEVSEVGPEGLSLRSPTCLVQGPCIHLEVSAGLRSVGCPLSEREQVAVLRGGR